MLRFLIAIIGMLAAVSMIWLTMAWYCEGGARDYLEMRNYIRYPKWQPLLKERGYYTWIRHDGAIMIDRGTGKEEAS